MDKQSNNTKHEQLYYIQWSNKITGETGHSRRSWTEQDAQAVCCILNEYFGETVIHQIKLMTT